MQCVICRWQVAASSQSAINSSLPPLPCYHSGCRLRCPGQEPSASDGQSRWKVPPDQCLALKTQPMINANRIQHYRLHASTLTAPHWKQNQRPTTTVIYIIIYHSWTWTPTLRQHVRAWSVDISNKHRRWQIWWRLVIYLSRQHRCPVWDACVPYCRAVFPSGGRLISAYQQARAVITVATTQKNGQEGLVYVGVVAIDVSRAGFPQSNSALRRDQTHFNSLHFRRGVPNSTRLLAYREE